MPVMPNTRGVLERGAIAFKWGSYLDYFNEDLEEMIVRPCITYADTIGQPGNGDGFTVTLKRIPAWGPKGYGDGKLQGIDARLNEQDVPCRLCLLQAPVHPNLVRQLPVLAHLPGLGARVKDLVRALMGPTRASSSWRYAYAPRIPR